MDNNNARALVEMLKPFQSNPGPEGYSFPCPRCGRYNMDKEKPTRNAKSRYADVYICDECGMNEGIRAAAGVKPLPLNEWAMSRNFGG